MKFGEAMTYLRIRKGITKTQIAKQVGCKVSDIYEYELSTREPRWSRAMEIIHALGYEVELKEIKKKQ